MRVYFSGLAVVSGCNADEKLRRRISRLARRPAWKDMDDEKEIFSSIKSPLYNQLGWIVGDADCQG